jgi:hypothetical protein
MKRWILFLSLATCILVSGCASPSQVLVNPETGQGYRCAHSSVGWGLMGAMGAAMTYTNQYQCVQGAKQMGYIEIEKLAGTGGWFDSREPLKEAIITKVSPNSPAHKAGVKVGDKVIEKNGQPIKCVGDIMSTGRLQIGEHVTYKVDRSGEILVFELVAVPFISLQK